MTDTPVPRPGEAVVELHQVGKRYGDVAALTDVTLTLRRGQVVALLGPNGAGKSTIFELLLGLLRPTSGDVRVLGEAPGRAVRERVGAMMQGAGLPGDVTVRELVRLVGRAYPWSLDVDDVLRSTALTDRARRAVTDLSGGERQRLLLAMALVGAPELLLLDEPTAALDVASRRTFWRQARGTADRGATILFATHHLEEAATEADRVVVLLGGRVVADGPPEVLTQAADGPRTRDLEDAFLQLTEVQP